MKQLALGLVVTAACSHGAPAPSADATPPGTVVLAWDLAQATRPAAAAATIGARTAKDLAYTAHPTGDTAVALAVHLELAPIQLAGEAHDAAVAATFRETDSGGYAISSDRCLGPEDQLVATKAGAVANPAARALVMSCRFRVKSAATTGGFTIYVLGDGTVTDGAKP